MKKSVERVNVLNGQCFIVIPTDIAQSAQLEDGKMVVVQNVGNHIEIKPQDETPTQD